MSGTRSLQVDRPQFWAVEGRGIRVDVALSVLAVVLLIAMVQLERFESIPYHIIFVLFAFSYGFRLWSAMVTALLLGLISVCTGAVLVQRYLAAQIGVEELAEIVLMPMIVAAMVWHARRGDAMRRVIRESAARETHQRAREEEFLRDVSHAMRTPLTIARGHLELIQEVATEPVTLEGAAIAIDELDRLNRLSLRLLTIAAVEQVNGIVTRPEDVSEFAAEQTRRWSAAVARDWRLDLSGPAWAPIDHDNLAVAFDALVENAVRVTSEHDVIRVICRRHDEWVTLAVADSGPGIPVEEREQVFDRFWSRRVGSEQPGSGLGLACASSVATAHGAGVSVSSAPEGGALVAIRLPALTKSPATGGSPRSSSAPVTALPR